MRLLLVISYWLPKCKQLEFFNDNKNLSKEAEETFHSAEAYLDKDKNKYIHLIDGGITDNLGLLAFEDLMNFGEIKKNQKKSNVVFKEFFSPRL